MIYWQSQGTYNKISLHYLGANIRLMSDSASELERLNSLDPQVITRIHDRYYPDVFRFARFRLNDDVMAEDIAGDVFMHLLEAVHNGHGPQTNLRGWLLKTTANIVNDHYRKLYNRPKDESTELLENSRDLFINQDDPVVLSDQAEKHRLVQSALEQLTEAQKLVITLRFGNRLSLEETAQLMGKNSNTIKALQYRALLALRKQLGNELL
jgi:RNA polymerase sigma-70 factor, ECF subfamily